MTNVITTKEIRGFIPTRIFMHTVSKHIKIVKCLYTFAGDVPEDFKEALKCQL